jgi:hypothetical protein
MLNGRSQRAKPVRRSVWLGTGQLGTILPYDGAYLNLELVVERRTPEFPSFSVFRVLPPGLQGFLGLELDKRHSLPVLC